MLEEINRSLNIIIQQTQANMNILIIILGIPWLVYFINLFLNNRLLYLGIIPRRFYGLPGIVFAPLLHANFNHLFFNSIPLVVLSNFILINGLLYFLYVTLFITLLSGFLIWCFAKPGIHLGASSLITGYWGLLVSDILQQGTVTAIILGIISLYYFAGIFLGIFPSKKGVSWEGHLFGLVAGLATNYLLRFFGIV
ncbi:rhomboid family intramembrane serine protease [Legionella jamestowniensis]|uniref:AraC family transcriptional regulator n=1 Tax=Legionella jamestowniensis TaxID=455 RepID=A0A0W0UGS2_9GAMM|nr:rhomboid family intramembrane serine protease [Legionella jamestowniensis]KTD07108.1 AraC family transcriptional regulator [Legionella jamestowniensis]OCH98940.1 rhomboid family intramembrane serine protease [Legionella jamestowniensis]SFL71004.1 Membrane associated serine protease, rhomboid family [Legionella jamestowniensis DSM 19215]